MIALKLAAELSKGNIILCDDFRIVEVRSAQDCEFFNALAQVFLLFLALLVLGAGVTRHCVDDKGVCIGEA